MDFKKPLINDYTDFELYLEGIKIPFSSVTIHESESAPPSLSIRLPAKSGALKILAKTVVHLYGPAPNPFTGIKEKILLFEGEVSGFGYDTTSNSSSISLRCQSLLASIYKAKAWPNDAIVLNSFRSAAGDTQAFILKDVDTVAAQTINKNVDETKALENTVSTVTNSENLSNLFGFTDMLLKQLSEDSPAEAGDFQQFLNSIFKYFELRDTSFGVNSRSYKLMDSVVAFPNPNPASAFQLSLLREIVNRSDFEPTNRQLYLIQGIMKLLTTIHYKVIMPSTFTSVPQSFSDNGGKIGPLRMLLLPKMDNAPPALCNVFFDEQIKSVGYSRDIDREPTRVIGSMEFNLPGINKDGGKEQLYSPYTVIPSVTALDGGYTNYTAEEMYRGIHSEILQVPGYFITALENELITKEDLKPGQDTYKLITEFTTREYLKRRFSGRQLSVSCEWSPYRMIGFPGVVLTKDLSITAIISSITTTIDSKGSISSSIAFNNPRPIFDQEENNLFLQKGAGDELINHYSVDSYSGLDGVLYNPDLYRFDKIGMDIYAYALLGQGCKREEFLTFKDSLLKTHPALTNLSSDKARRLDQSILNLIRNQETEAFQLSNTATIGHEYNYLIYKSIHKLRILNKQSDIQRTQLLVNWRNLLTKKEYENYLSITGTISDYKKPSEIFTNTEDVQKAIQSDIDKESLDTDIFKPYNLTRYLHVKEAMKGFIAEQNTKSIGVI